MAAKKQEEKPFKCDLCDASFVANKFLGAHKSIKHGIPGKSHGAISSRKYRERQAAEAEAAGVPIAELPPRRIGRPPGSKTQKRSTQLASTAHAQNGHQPAHESNGQSYTDARGISDALVALTTGRVLEILRSAAYEHDLPPKLFTARVSELVYAASLRELPRSARRLPAL